MNFFVALGHAFVAYFFIGSEGFLIRSTITGDEVVSFGMMHPNRVGPAPVAMRGPGKLVCLRGSIRGDKASRADELHEHIDPIGRSTPRSTIMPLRWKVVGGQCYVADFVGEVRPHFNFTHLLSFTLHATQFSYPLDGTVLTRPQIEANFRAWKSMTKRVADFLPFYYEQWETDWPQCRKTMFDFWIDSDGALELYVLNPDGWLTRRNHRPGAAGDVINGGKVPGWVWAQTWGVKWVEPFYLAASGRDRFFVTESGRVYFGKENAPLGELVVDVWKGSPVRVLIHDSNTAKSYAFTETEYFEIADPIKPKPHKIADVRAGGDATKALEVSLKCARVIRGLPVADKQPMK